MVTETVKVIIIYYLLFSKLAANTFFKTTKSKQKYKQVSVLCS